MQAAIAVVLSLFIIAALIYVNPLAALLATAAILSVYLLVSALARNRLQRNSKILGAARTERAQIIQESLGGIRDVLIGHAQAAYLETFRKVDARLSMAKANTGFISAAPRFIVEAIGMTAIAAVALFLAARAGSLSAAIPVLGALALGAQRILPLIQQIYVGWSMAAGNRSVIHEVLGLLRLPVTEEPLPAHASRPLVVHRTITLENVCFSYPGRSRPAIDRVSLEIRSGERVALIGRTGSGKSTLADLMMGLLEPAEGQIRIDGALLTAANRRQWQMNIAHVPQDVFLADASIAANIAFGAPARDADLQRVIEAARKAQLHAFVASLPLGYDTLVGERGVCLSGGERQRLGLARALYRQCAVLVLDEATSALDEETEAAVLQALDRSRDQTIIMIAHRPSTIGQADRTARLEQGRLILIEDRPDRSTMAPSGGMKVQLGLQSRAGP
jgi:ABC-type multidrug transport system fused ATPase/permease subunit